MAKQNIISRTIGVNFNNSARAQVLVWAPFTDNAELKLKNAELPMIKQERGYFVIDTDQLKPGDTYQFIVNGKPLPDPASLFQPEGVHGPSAAFDTKAFEWTDSNWQNLPLSDYIIYELHTGTFSADGTFKGIEQNWIIWLN